MYVCLSIPEILDIICNKLAPRDDLDGDRDQDHAALAALARTSRIFCEPALDVLWSDLGTILPLLRCMPCDVWEEWDVAGHSTLVVRPILFTDWTRFDYHARRVRGLGFSRCDGFMGQELCVNAAVYRALRLSRQVVRILPNLRNLSWSSEGGLLKYMGMLIGPGTRRIRLHLGPLGMAEQSLLYSLPAAQPDFVQISFVCDGILQRSNPTAFSVIAATLSNVACGWKCVSLLTPLTRSAFASS